MGTEGWSEHVARSLRGWGEEGLLRRVRTAPGPGPRTVLDGRPVISFASNDYLGLAADPRLADAFAGAAAEEGAGAGAARLMTGSRPSHDALERAAAALKGAEAALLFGSGYACNVSILPALAGEGDLVVSDRLNHASLVDGCRLAGAEVAVVPHRDAGAVREALRRPGFRRRLVVTEGLFSMEGRAAPLAALRDAAREAGALLVVDDAHGGGVLGRRGAGAAEEAGLEPGPDLLEVGTLGKAFGGYGAFAAWTARGIDFLRHRARGFVFSTALPPGVAAMGIEGMRIAAAEPRRRERVRALGDRLRAALDSAAGGDPGSPIVPIAVGDPVAAVRASERLLERGFWVPAVRPPTVPPGTARLRVSLSAAHEDPDVDALAAAIREALP
jgi:8-amino-7-oxononanoate synthase